MTGKPLLERDAEHSSGVARLRHHYVERLEAALEAKARGQRVVGLIGNTIPREMVLASDCFAVLIAADVGRPTPIADTYMEPVIPPETRTLFEAAVSGELEFLDLLVLSRPYSQLYYYLKEVHRMGRAPRLPRLHMFDLMQSQRDAVRAYNVGQMASLRARFERLSGAPVADVDLSAAIATTNSVRAAQRELLALRWQTAVSGADALQAIGAGYFMAPNAYVDALRECVAELQPREDDGRPKLVVMSSEPLSHLNLHHAIEMAGALVVAEDDWWGARAPGDDIANDGPPEEAILRKYWFDTHSSGVWPAHKREGWFLDHAARPDVDGVVFYLPPSDHQLGWDYPRLRDWSQARGKRSLLLRRTEPDVITAEVGRWLRQ